MTSTAPKTVARQTHITAIHVLKSRLRMSEDDYRALLVTLTAKRSSTDMTDAQRALVRDHLQRLAVRMGVVPAATRSTQTKPLTHEQFERAKAAASPRERKVWALWGQLHRDGLVTNPSRTALNAWVERTVHVSALGFATSAQLDSLIEALKAWKQRGTAANA